MKLQLRYVLSEFELLNKTNTDMHSTAGAVERVKAN